MAPIDPGSRRLAALAVLLALAGGAAADPVGVPSEAGQVRGLIEARHHAVLSSEIAGRIARLTVEAGQPFALGKTLADAFHNGIEP